MNMNSKQWGEYFDPQGIIKLTKNGPHPVENTPLYHVTYLIKYNLKSVHNVHSVLDFLDTPNKRIKGSRSHDNMTAILTYLVIILNDKNFEKHYPTLWKEVKLAIKEFDILPEYTHPRDFLYIAMLQNTWWFWLINIINPFAIFRSFLIIFAYMAARKNKVRNDKKIFKTDTEILYWIRTNLPKKYLIIHATKFIIVPLLRRKYGHFWFQIMMDIYYKEWDHPNRRRV